MKIATDSFYQELESLTNEIIKEVSEKYTPLTREQLLWRPQENKWSIGECLEHLIQYGNFYLTAMEVELAKGNKSEPKTVFKTGYFGNKFADMLRYKEQGMKKMKAPKIESLAFTEVSEDVVNVFLEQQKRHLKILEETKKLNLEKVKVPIALTKLIKTKIGDTLRFTIYHNQRHFIQAMKVFNVLNK